MNLIKTCIFLFFIQIGYSQTKAKYPTVLVLKNDTLVCFTTPQAKEMALFNEQRKECIELQKEDKKTLIELRKINETQLGIISNLETEIIQHKKNNTDNKQLLQICEDEKKSLKKEIVKQKIGKYIAIIGGVGLSLLCLAI
jgi:hypothetical protein